MYIIIVIILLKMYIITEIISLKMINLHSVILESEKKC